MKRIVWLLFLMAAAVLLAIAARTAEGNVAILLPPWRIDLSLNAAVLALILAFVVLYFLLALIGAARGLPERARLFRARVRERAATAGLAGAVRALMEGRWARAESLAAQASNHSNTQGVACLVAARASAMLNEPERSRVWLDRARASGDVESALDVVQAELLLDTRESQQALDAVERLHKRGARHVHTLRIKLKAALALQLWDDVLKVARQLEKHKALHPLVAAKTKSDAYQALFERMSDDPYGMTDLWQRIPASERVMPTVSLAAATAFNRAGLGLQARLALEAALAEQWDASLLRAYAVCTESSAAARIAQAEHWLERHPNDAALLATAGRLCVQDQLWGKARQYFQESHDLKASVLTAQGLAALAEQAGDAAAALRLYKEAARLALSTEASRDP
jgi:HemY protein